MISRTARIILQTILVVTAIFLWQCKNQRETSVFIKERFIAHAMGAVDGLVLSNSYEAFLENYNKGRRVFEVDFALTADGQVVLFHENPAFDMKMPVYLLSHIQFMEYRYMGKYTTIDLNMLIALLEENPDIYIVTDTKDTFNLVLFVLGEITRLRPGLVGRIIPQIYTPANYDQVVNKYPVQEVIYTLYKNNAISDDKVFEHVSMRPKITAVTMSTARFNPSLAKGLSDIGRYVFVHTVNDEKMVRKFIGQGAHGVYTDNYYQ
jgi:glycerophosphoryl diester phosphodiesterase